MREFDPCAPKKIIGIFPGENPKNTFMFYYIVADDSPVFYVAGMGRKPIRKADNVNDFKTKNSRCVMLDTPIVSSQYKP